ncbi:endonuclease/exonuclease/phosphatase family protein [Novipirellula caenicola]|uniref:Endonuclease/exonuclease/phosphatase domain-containing protein n=1 Tax=Novipirellula caenicola TaxID=1536901 RepID=A0ABP9VHY9_9BACT
MGLLSNLLQSSRSRSRNKSSSGARSVLSYIPFVRWIGPSVSFAGIAAALGMVVTGRIDLSVLDAVSDTAATSEAVNGTPVQPVAVSALGQRSYETVRLATFNIQMFGEKKSTTRVVDGVDVMGTLAQIVSQFDLVAIQEVRGGNAAPVERLVALINASGARYASTVSPPIGRTSQTECYAFVWDQTRIQMIRDSGYVVQDNADRMHREPMVASFQTIAVPREGYKPFSFTMINAHTDPDEVTPKATSNEINVLDDVFVRVRQFEYDRMGEEDCILLGDLNVDANHLQELVMIPNVVSIAGNTLTNTRRDKTYDHILIDREMTREYTGRFGVIDLQKDLALTEDQALLVSDHMPLWAEFSVYEVPQGESVASRNEAAPMTR